MILNILMVALGLTLSTYFFRKAAGTLSVRKLNLISYTYYLFVLQTYIGTSLVFLGDRGHYTLKYILHDASINKTFYFVLLTAILFPLVIILVYKILKVDMNIIYDEYLSGDVDVDGEEVVFYSILVVAVVSITLMGLLFYKIGYIPFFKMFFAQPEFNFMTERIKISNINLINQYVKNILVLSFMPVLSYISFVYAYTTRRIRWILLFGVMFVCSIFTKTYNFAKTPVVFYMFTFVLIYIIINNGIKRRYLYLIAGILGGIIILLYKVLGYKLELSIYNGPMGRILFTQAGTLIYHFDFFPEHFPFLQGRSLGGLLLRLLGSNMTTLRSAKVVMSFYGSRSVYDGTAGVMNAFFIGEAYANFGYIGVVLSIVYVALLFSIILYLFTKKFKKSALNVALLGILTSELTNITHGGFFDYIYNANLIIIILLFIIISYFSKHLCKDRKYKSKTF